MTQKITTQERVGTDGILHLELNVPAEWADQNVEIVIKPVHQATAQEEQKPKQTSAETQARLAAFQYILDHPVTDAPLLSDEDISRDRIYAERG